MIYSTPDSSNIAKFGWENGSLLIEFKRGGACWSYADVDFSVYTSMTQASSVGSFFAKEIKPNFVGTLLTANPFDVLA